MVDRRQYARFRHLNCPPGRLWPATMELLEVFVDRGDSLSPLHRRSDDSRSDGLSLSSDDAAVVKKCGIVGKFARNGEAPDAE